MAMNVPPLYLQVNISCILCTKCVKWISVDVVSPTWLTGFDEISFLFFTLNFHTNLVGNSVPWQSLDTPRRSTRLYITPLTIMSWTVPLAPFLPCLLPFGIRPEFTWLAVGSYLITLHPRSELRASNSGLGLHIKILFQQGLSESLVWPSSKGSCIWSALPSIRDG